MAPLSAMRVAALRLLQLGDGAEVAGLHLGHRRVRLALDDEQMAEPLGGVAARHVGGGGVGHQVAGDDAEQRDPAGERVGDGAPDERGASARLSVAAMVVASPALVTAGNGRSAGDGTSRTSASSSGCMATLVSAEVAEHREDLAVGDGRAPGPAASSSLVSVPSSKKRAISASSASATSSTSVSRAAAASASSAAGNRPGLDRAAAVGQVGQRLHRQQVDDALEAALVADRQGDRARPTGRTPRAATRASARGWRARDRAG